jgi:uncharacterized cofD-like protein
MNQGTGNAAVAIGGGTGLPVVLRCLLDLGYDTTAVVTMADDGGSSGALRRDLGILPPGDIRNCLVAMAGDPDGLSARLFQYRFPHGEGLAGHALGNLILAALADVSGDFVQAIGIAGEYLRVRGRVLPSTLADVRLHGVDRSGREVIGQARLAANLEPVACAFLEPERPPVYPASLEAIQAADAIVIGPGSLYTSIIPNFLVEGVAEAVRRSRARRVYVCNVANMRGETLGLDAADHVEALVAHGLVNCLDVVLVHQCDDDVRRCVDSVDPVASGDDVIAKIERSGADVVQRDLADPVNPLRHSKQALLRALEEVLG